MTQFKVGDRVAVYSNGSRYTGKIEPHGGNCLYIKTENTNFIGIMAHPKQCRKLRPGARPRSVWIREPLNSQGNHYLTYKIDGYTEFKDTGCKEPMNVWVCSTVRAMFDDRGDITMLVTVSRNPFDGAVLFKETIKKK